MPIVRIAVSVAALFCLLAAGCNSFSRAGSPSIQEQNRNLAERDRAEAAELETLRIHSRSLEEQLQRAEQELALASEAASLDRRQLANFEQERRQLRDQVQALLDLRSGARPEIAGRVAAVSQQFPALKFDPRTGVSRFDTDLLFDPGTAELKAGAGQALTDLVRALNAPESCDLRVLIVGHTDEPPPTTGGEKRHEDFYLSTARALAVTEQLRRLGLAERRMGVAGFGSHQPIAANRTPEGRQKNRRVELFVMAPDIPVIGWTETVPTLY